MSEKDPLLSNPADPVSVRTVNSGPRGVRVGEGGSKSSINNSSPEFGGPVKGSSTLYLSIFACVIGTSFAFGFGLGSINTSAQVMKNAYNDSFTPNGTASMSETEITQLWSMTVSFFCLGGMISAPVGGFIADTFGRKRSMLFMNIFHLIAVALMFTSQWDKSYVAIIVGRVVLGLYCGYATVVCPLYLNEISPSSLRGSVGTVHQLVITISLAIGQVLGLKQILGTEQLFYYILGMSAIPGVLHWILMAYCPESPSWLYLIKQDQQGARQALERLRESSSSVEAELEEYAEQERESASEPKVTLKDMFTTYRRRPLTVAAFMHFSQQLGGVNAVIFYSTKIFEKAKLSPANAQYATLGLGGILILMTFVSLLLIERLGRRTLHLHGLLGMFCCLALLTSFYLLDDVKGLEWMSYLCIVSVALYLAFFSVGPGAIPWFYTSEIFDPGSVKWAISIATFINWLSNFLVSFLFPYMQPAMNDYVFLPFMLLIAIFGIYLYYNAVETKNKNTTQITGHFRNVHSIANLPAEDRKLYQQFT